MQLNLEYQSQWSTQTNEVYSSFPSRKMFFIRLFAFYFLTCQSGVRTKMRSFSFSRQMAPASHYMNARRSAYYARAISHQATQTQTGEMVTLHWFSSYYCTTGKVVEILWFRTLHNIIVMCEINEKVSYSNQIARQKSCLVWSPCKIWLQFLIACVLIIYM